MAVADDVALALRLSSSAASTLSDEITRHINTASAEMIRVGVDEDVVTDQGELVTEAIVTYCQMKMGAPDRYEQYKDAWEWQLQNLRLSDLSEDEDEDSE